MNAYGHISLTALNTAFAVLVHSDDDEEETVVRDDVETEVQDCCCLYDDGGLQPVDAILTVRWFLYVNLELEVLRFTVVMLLSDLLFLSSAATSAVVNDCC